MYYVIRPVWIIVISPPEAGGISDETALFSERERGSVRYRSRLWRPSPRPSLNLRNYPLIRYIILPKENPR